jgi:anaerobic magnesium-protoporphyrin IX monomethyl ester cyclase
MVKIAFVTSPTSSEQMYGGWDLSQVDTYCPPLGVLYIASLVRKNNHIPYVIDVPALRWSLKETVNHVLSLNPDVVGISSMTINVLNAGKIAEELKREGIRAPIVIGGPHMTAAPVETLKRFSSIDYGVIGEGEITFLELIEKLGRHEPVSDIMGISWRDHSGEVVVNPPRPFIKDLDTLPLPAWDLLPNFPEAYPQSALETKRLPAASVITSRGCPHQCTFCDRSVFGSSVRHHGAEYTLDMIRHLKNEYRVKDLMILDDNFILDKKKLFQICDAIIEEEMDLRWYCLSHVRFMTEDRLKKIKKAGCWIMEVGIESGCERILKLLKRNTKKEEIAKAIKRAKQAGIRVKGNFIFGLPTETQDSLEETIQFATDIDISLFQQTFLTIWPGCELSQHAGQYGYVETDWGKLAHFQISFIPNGLTQEDLLQASKDAFRRFYLRPKIIFGMLTTLTSFRAIQNAMVAFVAFLKTILRKNNKSHK